MVGRTCVLENGIFVVLRMRSGEVSAVKIEIVLLLAMIGQWLARNLSSGDAATIGENREKQCIHAGTFLKHIENFLRAFIDKGNCSDLDADHFGGGSTRTRSRHGQGGTGSSGNLQKVATIHVRFQHAQILYRLLLIFLVSANVDFYSNRQDLVLQSASRSSATIQHR